MDSQDIRLNVRIPITLRDEFRHICKENAANGSELIRQWIENYVDEYTHKKGAGKELKIVMQKIQKIDK